MNDLSRPRSVALWLFVIVFMVVGQATIGAVTRLTESGLSIVRWEPVTGALPPMNEADWQDQFAAYKTSPQYEHVNRGMSLGEFKTIFWWEWIHRLWARLIGAVFAVPFILFWVKGWIPAWAKPRLAALFVLGGMQGVIGWWMVASGLIDNPAVSHYRLAAHLVLAVLIAALAMRWAVRLRGHDLVLPRSLLAHGWATIGMLFVTITYGAFVAGLDAGLIYNEFPAMGNGLFPAEGWALTPLWHNVFENHATVQFVHRWLGVLTGIMALAFAGRGLKTRRHPALFCVLITALVQPALGVATLLHQVPLGLATLHQLGALSLCLSLMWATAGPKDPR